MFKLLQFYVHSKKGCSIASKVDGWWAMLEIPGAVFSAILVYHCTIQVHGVLKATHVCVNNYTSSPQNLSTIYIRIKAGY